MNPQISLVFCVVVSVTTALYHAPGTGGGGWDRGNTWPSIGSNTHPSLLKQDIFGNDGIHGIQRYPGSDYFPNNLNSWGSRRNPWSGSSNSFFPRNSIRTQRLNGRRYKRSVYRSPYSNSGKQLGLNRDSHFDQQQQLLNNQHLLGNQQSLGNQHLLGNQQLLGNRNFLGNQQLLGNRNLLGNQQLLDNQHLLNNQHLLGLNRDSHFDQQQLINNQHLLGNQQSLNNQHLLGNQQFLNNQHLLGNQDNQQLWDLQNNQQLFGNQQIGGGIRRNTFPRRRY